MRDERFYIFNCLCFVFTQENGKCCLSVNKRTLPSFVYWQFLNLTSSNKGLSGFDPDLNMTKAIGRTVGKFMVSRG